MLWTICEVKANLIVCWILLGDRSDLLESNLRIPFARLSSVEASLAAADAVVEYA